MTQISAPHITIRLKKTIKRLSAKVRVGLKWWAEHQAWPAIDEIRIEDRNATEEVRTDRPTFLRF